MDDPELSVAAAVLLALASALTPAGVGAQPLPEHRSIPFAAYDRNGDGFIDAAEFAALRAQPAPAPGTSGQPQSSDGLDFHTLDGNGDGRLSAAEYRVGRRTQSARRRTTRRRLELENSEEMQLEMGK